MGIVTDMAAGDRRRPATPAAGTLPAKLMQSGSARRTKATARPDPQEQRQ